jgi:hypothetical protein
VVLRSGGVAGDQVDVVSFEEEQALRATAAAL